MAGDLWTRILTPALERMGSPFPPSFLLHQRPDTINIQVPFSAPSSYPFWNRRSELLIECECIRPELVRFECFREVMHRGTYSAKRLAELALQVSLRALRFDGLVLNHRPHSIRRIDRWHLPSADLNKEFLSSFSCSSLFDLLRHRFEYTQSLTFGLSIQTSYRLAK
jgi:hypothetical protein